MFPGMAATDYPHQQNLQPLSQAQLLLTDTSFSGQNMSGHGHSPNDTCKQTPILKNIATLQHKIIAPLYQTLRWYLQFSSTLWRTVIAGIVLMTEMDVVSGHFHEEIKDVTVNIDDTLAYIFVILYIVYFQNALFERA